MEADRPMHASGRLAWANGFEDAVGWRVVVEMEGGGGGGVVGG